MKKTIGLGLLVAPLTLLGGCAQVYGGLQFASQQQCSGLPDMSDYRRCMAERSVSKEDYDKSRAKVTNAN